MYKENKEKTLRHATSVIQTQETDIPRITKNILVNCNVFRRKTDEVRDVSLLPLYELFRCELKRNLKILNDLIHKLNYVQVVSLIF